MAFLIVAASAYVYCSKKSMSQNIYQLKPHERPMMAGSPSFPDHPWKRRLCYGIIGTIVGLTAGFTNGMMLANIPQIQEIGRASCRERVERSGGAGAGEKKRGEERGV